MSNGVTNVVDTVYDAGMPVEEVGYAQGTNTPYVSAMYLIGPRGPEYRRDVVHQSVSWYVYDGLGSIVEEVDPSGNITASRKYDVYGIVRSGQVGSSSQKYVGCLGHESDANTGLIYMRARYMDPVLGRFLSEDPGRDGANWFVYCEDNPCCTTDRNGQESDISVLDLLFILSNGMFELKEALEDFVGIPVAQKWVDQLAFYLKTYYKPYSFISNALSRLSSEPAEKIAKWTGLKCLVELTGLLSGARDIIGGGKMLVQAIGGIVLDDWVAITAADMAFEEGR